MIIGHTGRSGLLFSRAFFYCVALISSITVSIVSAIFVHCHWVVTFNEIWFPATALESIQVLHEKMGEDSRVADLYPFK